MLMIERRNPLSAVNPMTSQFTKPTKIFQRQKKETMIERGHPFSSDSGRASSEIPEWLQEFRAILVDWSFWTQKLTRQFFSWIIFRACRENTSKDPFSRCEICKNLGYRLSWRWQDKVGLQHPEEKNFVLGIACACWNEVDVIKPSCCTVRRPTPMTTWKPRSRVTSTRSTWSPRMTWHTWWTREYARSVSLLSPCSVSSVTLIPCTHRMAQGVRVFVSSHPWSERFF